MSSRVVVILGAGVAFVAGLALLFIGLSRPPAPAPAAEAPAERPAAASPAAEPAARPEPVAPRRETAPPAPAAPPEPAAPTTGTLRLVSDVPETSVFIDRKYLGTAPVTATGVAPGPHTIVFSATGYDAITETVDVQPGEREVAVSFREIRLDASAPAVHKHAFGSCRGTLSATPKGLTYTTGNRDDAFTVALTDLETFEVDYLQNNLRVKIRGGKTYNFEDPDGNRDRLFVFHRDVDKARQRMVAGGGQPEF